MPVFSYPVKVFRSASELVLAACGLDCPKASRSLLTYSWKAEQEYSFQMGFDRSLKLLSPLSFRSSYSWSSKLI